MKSELLLYLPQPAARTATTHRTASVAALVCSLLFVFSSLHFWDDLPYFTALHGQGHISYRQLQQILQETPNGTKVREWTSYYGSGLHLAGTNESQALWTRDRWKEFGVPKVQVVPYDVYLNYPVHQSLTLLKQNGSDVSRLYEARLREDLGDNGNLGARFPSFHGYSASGNVSRQYVYANFGTREDYDELLNLDVELEGMIAIVKYGMVGRSVKVQVAEEFGIAAVIMYTDPQQDGEITEDNGFEAFPNGPARNPTTIERGSVVLHLPPLGNFTPSDCPSREEYLRRKLSLPSIPSIPISFADALPFLKALNGHGPKADNIGQGWQGGGLGYRGVQYNVGPSPSHLIVNLDSLQNFTITPIWNVIGSIPGQIEDEVIIIGNHRDSWSPGGGDPNSGSAAMNEVIRSLGLALRRGWKPRRTIMFGSWDGQEYAHLGSTEWTEANRAWLSGHTVAYLNVVVATSGKTFRIHSSPLLRPVIEDAMGSVLSPNQSVKGQTLLEEWDGKVSPGSSSDGAIFLDSLGISSLDMGYAAGSKDPIYPYHSAFDGLNWMDNFGDPTWEYHTAVAKVWALMVGALSESPILPLSVKEYVTELQGFVRILKSKIVPESSDVFSFLPLEEALMVLRAAGEEFEAQADALRAKSFDTNPRSTEGLVREINRRYKGFERQFIYEAGLDDRPWAKHVVFGPAAYYANADPFPGLASSLTAGNMSNAKRWQEIIVTRIHDAATSLDIDKSMDLYGATTY